MPVPESILYLTEADVQRTLTVAEAVDLAEKGVQADGAGRVMAYITHPVLSGPAISNIENSLLDELVVTDTIPLSEEARQCTRVRQLSISELLGETMRRVSNEESVSSLYMD